MKLKSEKNIDQPDYPSFDDYVGNRDKYLRGLSLKGAALLASGAVVFGVGCSDSTAGTSAPPAAPANEELRLKGDIAIPAKPLPKPAPEVMVDGGMIAPEPSPKPVPPPPPAPAIRGRIMAPQKPAKPDTVTPPPFGTPKVEGKIVQPVPPVRTQGKPAAPAAPEAKIAPRPPEPAIAGGMPVPTPPVKPVPPTRGTPPPPAPPEKVTPPREPVKPDDATPDVPKEVTIAPRPPQVAIGGLMVAPEPPPAPKENEQKDGK